MNNSLMQITQAERMLAEASDLADIAQVRDMAQAAIEYAKAAKMGLAAQNHAARIKLLAERKAGELLAGLERGQGARNDLTSGNVAGSCDYQTAIKSADIEDRTARRWQQIASIPDEVFESFIDETIESEKELTTAAALRVAINESVYKVKEDLKNNPIPTPKDKYDVIVIDPPWEMKKIDRIVAPEQFGFDYPTMSIDEIKNFDVPATIAADDCHLFLWTTQKYLPHCFDILDSWGFKYVFTMVWDKGGGFQPFNLPQYNCEFILYAHKGSPKFADTKKFFTCFHAKRTGHSRKPDEFYQLVSRVCDGKKIEVFARDKREGFDSWGNES